MIKRFLSCDWGTSSFRLRLLDATRNEVSATFKNSNGIADTHSKFLQSGLDENEKISFYKNTLQQYIAQLNIDVAGLPIIISGMASSSIGIRDIPYADLPFDLNKGRFSTAHLSKTDQFNHDLYIISGLKTTDDAMRGEETILFGCDTASNDGMYIFPGTHSKHVQVRYNTVVDVKTYMTGEMFDLLANKSILSASVTKNDDDSMESFFKLGVQEAEKGSFLNKIFQVRINVLFKKLTPAENYHYLSGLIIATELKELVAGNNVFIVSEHLLLKRYLRAAELLQLINIKAINAEQAFINAHLKLGKILFG